MANKNDEQFGKCGGFPSFSRMKDDDCACR